MLIVMMWQESFYVNIFAVDSCSVVDTEIILSKRNCQADNCDMPSVMDVPNIAPLYLRFYQTKNNKTSINVR